MRISDWSSDVCSSDLSDRADLRYDAHLHFPRPADVSAYEQVFGGTLRFSQPDSKMIFPAAYMQLPVANADDDLRRQVEARAQSMLQRLSGEPEARKSGVSGKRVSVRVEPGGRRSLKKKKNSQKSTQTDT